MYQQKTENMTTFSTLSTKTFQEDKNTTWFLETCQWNDSKKKFHKVWCESNGVVVNETSKVLKRLSTDWKQTFGL